MGLGKLFSNGGRSRGVVNRRSLLGLVARAGGGALLASLGMAPERAAAACRRAGKPCESGKQCCARRCRKGRCAPCPKGSAYLGPKGRNVGGGYCASVFAGGEWGSGPGQFADPTAVAVDAAGNVLVADSQNHRVQRFSADGAFVQEFGGEGAAPGHCSYPVGVAVDAHGDIFVTELGNHRVQRFRADGGAPQVWGGFGNKPGEFMSPWGIAISGQYDRLCVAEQLGDRVQCFSTAAPDPGATAEMLEWAFGNPISLAVDADHVLHVGDFTGDRVRGYHVKGFASEGELGASGSGAGELRGPAGLAALPAGLMVADSGNHRLQLFRRNGPPIVFGSNGGKPGQFAQPTGLAAGPEGVLYLADRGNNRIQKLTPVR